MMLRNGMIHLIIMKMINDLLPIGKNKKVIGLFKDESVGRIMKEFCALGANAYSYLMDDNSEVKKSKRTKPELMFENYKDCLLNDNVILKLQQRFKSYNHDVYTEEVNKVALSSNDDKRNTSIWNKCC